MPPVRRLYCDTCHGIFSSRNGGLRRHLITVHGRLPDGPGRSRPIPREDLERVQGQARRQNAGSTQRRHTRLVRLVRKLPPDVLSPALNDFLGAYDVGSEYREPYQRDQGTQVSVTGLTDVLIPAGTSIRRVVTEALDQPHLGCSAIMEAIENRDGRLPTLERAITLTILMSARIASRLQTERGVGRSNAAVNAQGPERGAAAAVLRAWANEELAAPIPFEADTVGSAVGTSRSLYPPGGQCTRAHRYRLTVRMISKTARRNN
jgi:hypothetical protein